MDPDPAAFLDRCEIIDFDELALASMARTLAGSTPTATAKRCFEWVRDEIRHSSDYCTGPVTCRASEVLKHRTGYCYAKSHLLCALLRASGIPAGLCYQRLSVAGGGAPFCLHGLNAVHLPEYGWYRIDARGQREDLCATFNPPEESLAFKPQVGGEADMPGIFVSPLPIVVDCLRTNATWEAVLEDLPDLPAA